ncbi:MAG: glutathione S-transferase [Planctomycetaceae bacterium]|jgi:glutathione S-transferase
MIKMTDNASGSSPYCRKAFIVLEELELEYEKVITDPETIPAEFKDINPAMRVSVLTDNGKHYFESDVIQEYLLRNYYTEPAGKIPLCGKRTLNFNDSMELTIIETTLNAGVNICLMDLSNFDPNDIKPWGWVWARDRERVHSCLNWLDKRVTPEGFDPGLFTVRDINLICALNFLENTTIDWRGYTNLLGHHIYWNDRPSVVATR